MTFTEYVPGMKPGSTIRNIIVGLVYLFFIYLVPFVLAYAVFTNRNGIADKLSDIPGISKNGGVVSAVAIFFISFVFLAILGAVLPGGDTASTTESPSSDDAATDTEGTASDEELEEAAAENAEEETEEQDTDQNTNESETNQESEEQETTQDTEEQNTNQEAEEEDRPQETEQADSTDGSISIRVDYDGEWAGAVGSEGSTRSVDGSGTEEIAIDGDPSVVSANAQKQDDSSNQLTIQILQDGEVIAEESTTAEYGVASVSESFF